MQAFAAFNRAIDRSYDRFGWAATYRDREGGDTPCTVLVERDMSRYGEVAQVNVRTAVVSVRLSEVAGAPRRSETFTISAGPMTGQVLTVDSVQASDEFEHRVFAA